MAKNNMEQPSNRYTPVSVEPQIRELTKYPTAQIDAYFQTNEIVDGYGKFLLSGQIEESSIERIRRLRDNRFQGGQIEFPRLKVGEYLILHATNTMLSRTQFPHDDTGYPYFEINNWQEWYSIQGIDPTGRYSGQRRIDSDRCLFKLANIPHAFVLKYNIRRSDRGDRKAKRKIGKAKYDILVRYESFLMVENWYSEGLDDDAIAKIIDTEDPMLGYDELPNNKRLRPAGRIYLNNIFELYHDSFKLLPTELPRMLSEHARNRGKCENKQGKVTPYDWEIVYWLTRQQRTKFRRNPIRLARQLGFDRLIERREWSNLRRSLNQAYDTAVAVGVLNRYDPCHTRVITSPDAMDEFELA